MATTTESARNTRTTTGHTRSGGAAMTTDAILDLVQRLGLVDLVTSRVRQRIEEVDIDELFDELGMYVRRNPEVLVVALAAITVSAGLIVYLNGRREDFLDEDGEEQAASRPVRVAANRATAPRARR